MSAHHADLIDQVLSITPGSRLDGLRRHRQIARDNIQQAYSALFEPVDASQISLLERLAVASFVTGLQAQFVLADHYAHSLLVSEGGSTLAATITGEIERGLTKGPYGSYPTGPLSSEDKSGLDYRVANDNRAILGQRLSAAFEHAHLLVFHPRDAGAQHLQSLLDAGWSTPAIVTLSQLIAYLAFQVRIVDGLAAIAASSEVRVAANTHTAALAAAANS